MIKLPTSIKIDNITYTVKLVPDLVADDDPNESLLGCVSYSDAVIKISKQSKDSAVNSLGHEISHAIFFERNIDDLIKDKDSETVVDCVAKAFVQIIRDNPELRDFIRDKKGKKKK